MRAEAIGKVERFVNGFFMKIIISFLSILIGSQIALREARSRSAMGAALDVPYGVVVDHPDDVISAACKADENCMDVFLLDDLPIANR